MLVHRGLSVAIVFSRKGVTLNRTTLRLPLYIGRFPTADLSTLTQQTERKAMDWGKPNECLPHLQMQRAEQV